MYDQKARTVCLNNNFTSHKVLLVGDRVQYIKKLVNNAATIHSSYTYVSPRGVLLSYSKNKYILHSGYCTKMTTQSDKLSSSITWSGSLVGSSNPNQAYGYTSFAYSKRLKTDSNSIDPSSMGGESHDLPSSIILQFQNRQGETVGSPIDVPLDHSSVDDLSMLSNFDVLFLFSKLHSSMNMCVFVYIFNTAALIHTLLQAQDETDPTHSTSSSNNNNHTPYAFYVQKTKRIIDTETSTSWEEPVEITSSLTQYLSQQLKDSQDFGSITEQVLTVVFQPLAIFRVRPGQSLFFIFPFILS